jgi:plasmid maintenance system killer protein
MTLDRTAKFDRHYAKAPYYVQRAFDKQSLLLLKNLHHPSLHAKKYDEGEDIWQARVNRHWRFYFAIQGDVYLILSIIPHPK